MITYFTGARVDFVCVTAAVSCVSVSDDLSIMQARIWRPRLRKDKPSDCVVDILCRLPFFFNFPKLYPQPTKVSSDLYLIPFLSPSQPLFPAFLSSLTHVLSNSLFLSLSPSVVFSHTCSHTLSLSLLFPPFFSFSRAPCFLIQFISQQFATKEEN